MFALNVMHPIQNSLHLMVFQQVNHLVQMDTGFGISTKPGGDGMHNIFQRLDDRPLSVLLVSLDFLKLFSDSGKKMSTYRGEGKIYCLR